MTTLDVSPRTPALATPEISTRAALLFAFLAFAILHTVQIGYHVPWADEHQAWLIAADSTLSTLRHNLRHEGHPGLWHLLLMGAHAIHADPVMMKVVQWLLAVGTVGIVLARAPLSPWLRILVCANYFLVFEYAAMARSYSLGVFLWALALATWRHAVVWLVLALMMHVSVHFLVMAGALAFYRQWEAGWPARETVLAAAALLLSATLSAMVFMPAPGTIPALEWNLVPIDLRFQAAVLSAGSALFPLGPYGGWYLTDWIAIFPVLRAVTLVAAFMAVFVLFADDPRRKAVALGAIAFAFLFTVAVYPLYARHIGIVSLTIVAMVWLGGLGSRNAERVFVALCVAWAAQGAAALVLKATGPVFSSNTEAARWIVANGLGDKRWASTNGLGSLAITVETGKPVYGLKAGCAGTFLRWNFPHEEQDFALARDRMARAADDSGTLHLLHILQEKEDRLPPGPEYTLLARFGPDPLKAVTTLYRVKLTPSADRSPVPACP